MDIRPPLRFDEASKYGRGVIILRPKTVKRTTVIDVTN